MTVRGALEGQRGVCCAKKVVLRATRAQGDARHRTVAGEVGSHLSGILRRLSKGRGIRANISRTDKKVGGGITG